MASSSNQPRSSPTPPSAFNNTQRPRPVSRRTTSYDIRLYETSPLQHHHRSTSSSALQFNRPHIFTRSISPATPPPPPVNDPRFSRLFTSVLGSPFLTTSDPIPQLELNNLEPNSQPAHARPSSPAPTADFSIIDMDIDDVEMHPEIPGSYPSNHSRFLSASMASLSFSPGRTIYASTSNSNWGVNNHANPNPHDQHNSPLQASTSFKSFLPRLWEALSTPPRAVLNFSPSGNVNAHSPHSSPSSSRTPSPSASPRRHANQSWYANNGTMSGRNSPVYWNTGKGKGKSKSGGLFSTRNGSRAELKNINYSELPPLDGEEGELIDDEACFIDSRAIHGIDILSLLPPELALHVLTLLSPRSGATFSHSTTISSGRSSLEPDLAAHEALRALLACRLVSKRWCRLASDNDIWRALFLGRWNIDLRRAADADMRSMRRLGVTWDFDLIDVGPKAKRVLGLTTPVIDAPVTIAPLRLDWRLLYRQRLELDRRWAGTQRVKPAADHEMVDVSTRRMGGVYNNARISLPPLMGNHAGHMEDSSGTMPGTTFEPTLTQIAGHIDSVYCLEFDSRRIITGSRDRTIKIWSLRTGRLLGTLVGVHRGSVLCLKFAKDWDRDWEWDDSLESEEHRGDSNRHQASGSGANPSSFNDLSLNASNQEGTHNTHRPQWGKRRASGKVKKGFMVSGSSDCSVCVWDLHLGPTLDDDNVSMDSDVRMELSAEDYDREVVGEVRQILRGHVGGVLDLRIDKHWIVSCSKDAVIRVWNRRTLELHRTLRGHEGPVNAVGLQSGRVVSASGDGKMILWDIESGERLKTFEGHDRGLACIEFKDDFIVSGSNDCKIKVWSASTGDCIRTLVGHEALVRALSFCPRSGRLVSASYDKSVKLWDLGTGKLVRDFKGAHTSHIFDVKFDVSRIVSTSHDQKIVILDFSMGLNASLFV